MAITEWTVFYNVRDGGNQKPAIWKEKELVTGKGLEKNNSLKSVPSTTSGTLVTNEVNECYFVTVEAESGQEALEAVTTYYTRGITNPEKNAPAVPVQGMGGGFTNNKGLAVKTSNLEELVATFA